MQTSTNALSAARFARARLHATTAMAPIAARAALTMRPPVPAPTAFLLTTAVHLCPPVYAQLLRAVAARH